MRIISGKSKGKKLNIPTNKQTRPLKDMVRESIFNIINHSKLLSSDFNQCTILDLFAGVGSFGLEAISRGAKKVSFFENFKPALDMLHKNIKNLSYEEQSEIYNKNIYDEKSFEKLNVKFDIVFLDPPYKYENLDLILKKIVNSKFISNKTLIILHRHKKTKDSFIKEFKIVREEIYGSSKIFFGFFNF